MLPDFIQEGRTVITVYGNHPPMERVVKIIDNRFGDDCIYVRYHDTLETSYFANGQFCSGLQVYESLDSYNAAKTQSARLLKLMAAVNDMSDYQRIELLEIIYEKFALDYR